MRLSIALTVASLLFGAQAQAEASTQTFAHPDLGLNVFTLYGAVTGHITTANTDGKGTFTNFTLDLVQALIQWQMFASSWEFLTPGHQLEVSVSPRP